MSLSLLSGRKGVQVAIFEANPILGWLPCQDIQ